MKVFQKFRHWKFSNNRLEAFSDGIFAIVITLLVLEIKVPHLPEHANGTDVWNGLRQLAPKIFSWLISFIFVAIMWLQHHHILRMATSGDYGIVWINNFLLLSVTFFPFTTAMLGEYPRQPHVVMMWGLFTSLTTLFLALLYRYTTKHYLRNSYNIETVKRNVRLSFFAGPLLYAIAGLLALWDLRIAYGIYWLVPLLYILPLDKEVNAGQEKTTE